MSFSSELERGMAAANDMTERDLVLFIDELHELSRRKFNNHDFISEDEHWAWVDRHIDEVVGSLKEDLIAS